MKSNNEYKKLLRVIEKWSFDEAIEIPEKIYKQMRYLLERSDNIEYAKCAEQIYNATFSSSDIFTVEKIEQILKTYFA